MKALTKLETLRIFEEVTNVAFSSERQLILQSSAPKLYLRLNDKLHVSALCREITNLFHTRMSVLYITEYGVWPSYENRHLFDIYMSGLGLGFTGLVETPGFSFGDNNRDELKTVLQLCGLFIWGGILFSDKDKYFIFSHDNWGVLISDKPLGSIIKVCDTLKIEYST